MQTVYLVIQFSIASHRKPNFAKDTCELRLAQIIDQGTSKIRFNSSPTNLAEQRAIAAALSDVDDQIAALDALIAKKRDIKQGVMQRLLTGEERLPGFSGEWEVKRLGEIADMTGEEVALIRSYGVRDLFM